MRLVLAAMRFPQVRTPLQFPLQELQFLCDLVRVATDKTLSPRAYLGNMRDILKEPARVIFQIQQS